MSGRFELELNAAIAPAQHARVNDTAALASALHAVRALLMRLEVAETAVAAYVEAVLDRVSMHTTQPDTPLAPLLHDALLAVPALRELTESHMTGFADFLGTTPPQRKRPEERRWCLKEFSNRAASLPQRPVRFRVQLQERLPEGPLTLQPARRFHQPAQHHHVDRATGGLAEHQINRMIQSLNAGDDRDQGGDLALL